MTLFITGTDTHVGKTSVTGLLAYYLQTYTTVVTQKWVQTGSTFPANDIVAHLSIMEKKTSDFAPYLKAMSPYVFSYPASPHLAAEKEGIDICIDTLLTRYRALANHFDTVIVEGSGGVLVPINDHQLMIDCVEQLSLPTIIVVANKLGCLNHTLLTIEALASRKIPVLGLVVTHLNPGEPDDIVASNLSFLRHSVSVPLLGVLPYSLEIEVLKRAFVSVGDAIQKYVFSAS